MKMEQCSETSAYKIQTPGNYPEESIQQLKHIMCRTQISEIFPRFGNGALACGTGMPRRHSTKKFDFLSEICHFDTGADEDSSLTRCRQNP
jgi:hypothetical protein